MNDDDLQAREKEATAKLLDVYQKLVEMAILEATSGGKAKRVTETVDRMTEDQAKAMLLARIGADVHARVQAAQGDEPKLN
jgi:hypothetical protein